MNNQNKDEDIMPLSPEEIKAIGEIELGPSKHEQFLNEHYKKLLWGGITLGIAAGCVIAYFSTQNDRTHQAAAVTVAAMKGSSLLQEVTATVSSSKGKVDQYTLRKLVLAYGGDEAVEGNAGLVLNKTDLIVFFDRYRSHTYGASLSRDHGETWEDVSSQIQMPEGMSHGTAFQVDKKVVEKLIKAYGI